MSPVIFTQVIHQEFVGRVRDPRASSDITSRLRHILSILLAQSEGNFLVMHEPEKREMVIYHHVEGLETRPQSLDLHATIDASAAVDTTTSASNSWVRWLWPSSGSNDHIPGTFVPRNM